jgi:hypothetical protein
MWIDNQLRRLRDILCSTALAVAPLTSIIVGIPLIGYSLAFVLCRQTERNDDSSLQRKKLSADSERTRAHGTDRVAWRNSLYTSGADTHNSRE